MNVFSISVERYDGGEIECAQFKVIATSAREALEEVFRNANTNTIFKDSKGLEIRCFPNSEGVVVETSLS